MIGEMCRAINEFFDSCGPHSRTKTVVGVYLMAISLILCNLIDVAREIQVDSAKSADALTRCADDLKAIREATDKLP